MPADGPGALCSDDIGMHKHEEEPVRETVSGDEMLHGDAADIFRTDLEPGFLACDTDGRLSECFAKAQPSSRQSETAGVWSFRSTNECDMFIF